MAGASEPEGGDFREHDAATGHTGWHNHVKGGDAIRRDEQQRVIAEIIRIANLAAMDHFGKESWVSIKASVMGLLYRTGWAWRRSKHATSAGMLPYGSTINGRGRIAKVQAGPKGRKAERCY